MPDMAKINVAEVGRSPLWVAKVLPWVKTVVYAMAVRDGWMPAEVWDPPVEVREAMAKADPELQKYLEKPPE